MRQAPPHQPLPWKPDRELGNGAKMKDLMQCSLCGEAIIRDHEGQVIVLRNKLVVFSDGGIVRVKCPKCGKLQVVQRDVLEEANVADRLS